MFKSRFWNRDKLNGNHHYDLCFTGCLLDYFVNQEQGKTKKAFKIAGNALLKSASVLLTVFGIVGLTLGHYRSVIYGISYDGISES